MLGQLSPLTYLLIEHVFRHDLLERTFASASKMYNRIEENPFLLVCAKDWNHFHSIMSEDHLEELSAMFVTNPVVYEKILNDDAQKNQWIDIIINHVFHIDRQYELQEQWSNRKHHN